MSNKDFIDFKERFYTSLMKEGVVLNHLLDFGVSDPIRNLNKSIIIGFGIKDGYVEHVRTGTKKFDDAIAKELVKAMQEVSKNYIFQTSQKEIKALSEELQIQHILVPAKANSLLLSTAYLDVLKDHEIPKLIQNENYIFHVKNLYKEISARLFEVLKENGFDPKNYEYQFKTEAEKTIDLYDERTRTELKKQNIVDNTVNVLLSNGFLKNALTKGPIYYDLSKFNLDYGIDNYAVIKFAKGSIKLTTYDANIGENIVKAFSNYLSSNGGSQEIINTLNSQIERTLFHRDKYKNLVLFENETTINIDKKLIMEIDKIVRSKAPKTDIAQLRGPTIQTSNGLEI